VRKITGSQAFSPSFNAHGFARVDEGGEHAVKGNVKN
jgi:hypothetical protein